MSHELRTPLNAIIGFAEILRYQMFGPLGNDRYVGYVDDIQRSGQHLLSLINDILDMSKIEAGRQALKLERQVLSPLIERSIRMAQPIAERRSVNLKFHANGADLSANCDSRAVTQMVINLVSNAVKFSPPGGTVDIRLEPSSLGGAKISVADGGPGIEEEVLPHLFEAYAHRAAADHAAPGRRRPRPRHHQGADRAAQRPDPRGDPARPRHHHDLGTAAGGAVKASARCHPASSRIACHHAARTAATTA